MSIRIRFIFRVRRFSKFSTTKNLKLWQQVVDLLADTADDIYSLTPVYGGKRGESVIGNGIEFDQAGVFWSNKDLLSPTKWEEVVGQT